MFTYPSVAHAVVSVFRPFCSMAVGALVGAAVIALVGFALAAAICASIVRLADSLKASPAWPAGHHVARTALN